MMDIVSTDAVVPHLAHQSRTARVTTTYLLNPSRFLSIPSSFLIFPFLPSSSSLLCWSLSAIVSAFATASAGTGFYIGILFFVSGHSLHFYFVSNLLTVSPHCGRCHGIVLALHVSSEVDSKRQLSAFPQVYSSIYRTQYCVDTDYLEQGTALVGFRK
ncbi:hypothetical protein FPOAC1_003195 [Fusarium poae]|uniref:hypothetical protein n=1 Tax=Fusarium poae TaxID=36050 RepID=UPI001CE8AD1B|nr:hypothetical protein FPOAC1_003195 [Fusarium poae]KAG8677183.1 hypothetical protein FPOAC1_003195 [Fusarium poae]